MKIKYKYIEFTKVEDDLWEINNHKYEEKLATLEWHKKWKQWELCPFPMVAFTQDCLEDVIHFIKQLKEAK